ncbi:protein tramtrack, beta isoform isoform X3 [Cydia strobilella]|uniref:protein tramtrack, beta isoform isoform X3 n=1 Tax=Cydia strobilella TaxID=1100964 RepID=UPI00300509C6
MASDEQFSLCWNNFHANMSAGFHGLLSRGDLVDVTLAAEGRLLQAHKLVLSVCSPYFQEMFKMNPTQHPIVFLKDVSHSALRDLLQFMYQGEVNVKQEELASFISTAEQLQVKGLTGNQNEESSTPSKPKPTSRPGPRSSQQRQSVMTKLETDLDSKPSSTPVAIKRPNRPSIASNNSSSSQSGPVKRKCVDPLEAGPSGSAKEEFVTIPDEDENNAVAPKMEPEFVNESMWDDDDDGTNNDETNFGEDDSNMEMTGFDGSTTGDGNLTGGAEGGAVGDAQGWFYIRSARGGLHLVAEGHIFYEDGGSHPRRVTWRCARSYQKAERCQVALCLRDGRLVYFRGTHNHSPTYNPSKHESRKFEVDPMVRVIYNETGYPKLMLDGYLYRPHNAYRNQPKVLWYCAARGRFQCTATLRTFNREVVAVGGAHNHAA